MMRNLIFITIVTTATLLFPLVALSQEPLTAPPILDSFERIIRNKQYICQKCNSVQPIGTHNKSRVYRAKCKYNYSYEILLTPNSDMIVKPLSENFKAQEYQSVTM